MWLDNSMISRRIIFQYLIKLATNFVDYIATSDRNNRLRCGCWRSYYLQRLHAVAGVLLPKLVCLSGTGSEILFILLFYRLGTRCLLTLCNQSSISERFFDLSSYSGI